MKRVISLLLVLMLTVSMAFAGNVNEWDESVWEEGDLWFEITWRGSKDVDMTEKDDDWEEFDITDPLDYLLNISYFSSEGEFAIGNGKPDKKMKDSFLHLTIVGYLQMVEEEFEFIPYDPEVMAPYMVKFNVKWLWDEGWQPFHYGLNVYMLDEENNYNPIEYDHGYEEDLAYLDPEGMTPNGFGSIWKLFEIVE